MTVSVMNIMQNEVVGGWKARERHDEGEQFADAWAFISRSG